MNISYQWLRSLAPGLRGTAAELADRLAMYGAPVEEMVDLGSPLADVIVARVAEVTRHPNADRLSLCRVDAGGGELLPVVCGAPNVRAGGFYPFIPAGGGLPGGVRVRRAKIRGEESRGMLCSERELGLGRDHAGILELHGDFEPGQRFIDAVHLDDVRLDVEVTPNRPDLLSHLGLARELAPGGAAGVALPPFAGRGGVPQALAFPDGEPRMSTADGVTVTVDAPAACPHYAGAILRGVTVGPSPEWLASRLRAVGLRPISNVVDATNWVLYELGQPLHAFDLDKLGGDVVVRMARAAEELATLDGKRRELAPEMLVIADAARPVALAGVIGGRDTEVSSETRDVFLECAIFDPRVVRQAARALDVSTDASYRFERGVDPSGVERALRRAVELIQTVAGGDVVPSAAYVRARPYEALSIRLRASRVEQVLGVALGLDAMAGHLEALGFGVTAEPDAALRVEVPGHRSFDVFREDDLVEEVARRHGYDAIPVELRPYRPSVVPSDAVAELEDRLRTMLVGRGFLESRTAAFASPDEGDVALLRPLSANESRLRRALLPALIRGVEGNFNRGARDVRLFELGTVFAPGPGGETGVPPAREGARVEPLPSAEPSREGVDGTPARAGREPGRGAGPAGLPVESTRLGVILTGAAAPPHWDGGTPAFDIWDLKGLADQVAEALGVTLDTWDAATAKRDADMLLGRHGILESARSLEGPTRLALLGDGENGSAELIGLAGRVRADAIDAPPWAAPVWAIEVDLAGLAVPALPAFRPLPSFPSIERDIALVVPNTLPAAGIEATVRAAAGALLEEARVFDVYAGESLGGDRRSIGLRLRFRAPDRTLTDSEIDAVVNHVLGSLRDEHGVEHRG